MSDGSSSGIWKIKKPHGGIFVYKCMATNSGGTGNSTSVAVIVNGKKSQNDFTILRASITISNLVYCVFVCLIAPSQKTERELVEGTGALNSCSRTTSLARIMDKSFCCIQAITWALSLGHQRIHGLPCQTVFTQFIFTKSLELVLKGNAVKCLPYAIQEIAD